MLSHSMLPPMQPRTAVPSAALPRHRPSSSETLPFTACASPANAAPVDEQRRQRRPQLGEAAALPGGAARALQHAGGAQARQVRPSARREGLCLACCRQLDELGLRRSRDLAAGPGCCGRGLHTAKAGMISNSRSRLTRVAPGASFTLYASFLRVGPQAADVGERGRHAGRRRRERRQRRQRRRRRR